MFGFPLTAYVISSGFGLTLFEREFTLYMHRVGMPVGSFVTFLGILLIVFGWREVYRTKDRLATQGIYAYLRHPQYLGILLITGGWLIHWPTAIGLVMWPILMVAYDSGPLPAQRLPGVRREKPSRGRLDPVFSSTMVQALMRSAWSLTRESPRRRICFTRGSVTR